MPVGNYEPVPLYPLRGLVQNLMSGNPLPSAAPQHKIHGFPNIFSSIQLPAPPCILPSPAICQGTKATPEVPPTQRPSPSTAKAWTLLETPSEMEWVPWKHSGDILIHLDIHANIYIYTHMFIYYVYTYLYLHTQVDSNDWVQILNNLETNSLTMEKVKKASRWTWLTDFIHVHTFCGQTPTFVRKICVEIHNPKHFSPTPYA